MSHFYDLEPAEFLVENIGLLSKGRALDLAMGTGQNTIYLAEMGFEVEGIDISRKAVNKAIESAARVGVTIKAQIADLENDYYIEKEAYNLIICFNYLQRSLIRHIKDGLKRGGIIVYETFIVDQARFGKPSNPEFLLKYNELLDMFRDFRCLRYREGILPGPKAVAGIVAEKV